MAGNEISNFLKNTHRRTYTKSRFDKSTDDISPFSNGYFTDTETLSSSNRGIHNLNSAMYVESYDLDDNNSYNDDRGDNSKRSPNSSEFHLDLSECLDSTRTITTRPSMYPHSEANVSKNAQIRYINPAIFIEKLNPEIELRNGTRTRRCIVENPHRCQSGIELSKKTKKNIGVEPHREANSNGFYSPKSRLHRQYLRENQPTRNTKVLSFEEWLIAKEEEKQKKLLDIEADKNLKEQQEQEERQRRLDRQREEFKAWLNRKKELEKQRKIQEEQEMQKLKLEQERKARQMLEKEDMFKAWLKRKEEIAKEKKKKEEIENKKKESERHERRQRSVRAFEQWMEKSKNGPRPVPLNMGVESLRGSVSAMFVNPTPWQENINDPERPST